MIVADHSMIVQPGEPWVGTISDRYVFGNGIIPFQVGLSGGGDVTATGTTIMYHRMIRILRFPGQDSSAT